MTANLKNKPSTSVTSAPQKVNHWKEIGFALLYSISAFLAHESIFPTNLGDGLTPANLESSSKIKSYARIAELGKEPSPEQFERVEWKILKSLEKSGIPVVTVTVLNGSKMASVFNKIVAEEEVGFIVITFSKSKKKDNIENRSREEISKVLKVLGKVMVNVNGQTFGKFTAGDNQMFVPIFPKQSPLKLGLGGEEFR